MAERRFRGIVDRRKSCPRLFRIHIIFTLTGIYIHVQPKIGAALSAEGTVEGPIMPLYLVPLPKIVNGDTVDPWRSVGGKAFDPDDAESMEYLQALHSQMQQRIRPERRSLLTPLFALFGVRFPAENPTVTSFRERWGRPFEDILAEATAAPEEYVIRQYDPQQLKETEYLAELEDHFPWFPFYALYDFEGPDGEPRTNDVVIGDEDAELAFLDFEGQGPKQPEDMRGVADIFDRAARNYRPDDDDIDPEISLFAVRAASEWLRFWADREHPCEAHRMLWSGQGWYRIEVG
jgi:hypothetical protein